MCSSIKSSCSFVIGKIGFWVTHVLYHCQYNFQAQTLLWKVQPNSIFYFCICNVCIAILVSYAPGGQVQSVFWELEKAPFQSCEKLGYYRAMFVSLVSDIDRSTQQHITRFSDGLFSLLVSVSPTERKRFSSDLLFQPSQWLSKLHILNKKRINCTFHPLTYILLFLELCK